MASELKGLNGKVTFTNGQTYVHNWTLSYVAGTHDTTNFDSSSGGKVFIAGVKEWSGSYDCFYSTGNTAVPGTTGTIKLETATTGSTGYYLWTGGIIITGMDITTPVDGVVTQNYSFQGTGLLGTT